jgi:hypothetical protein
VANTESQNPYKARSARMRSSLNLVQYVCMLKSHGRVRGYIVLNLPETELLFCREPVSRPYKRRLCAASVPRLGAPKPPQNREAKRHPTLYSRSCRNGPRPRDDIYRPAYSPRTQRKVSSHPIWWNPSTVQGLHMPSVTEPGAPRGYSA